MQLPHTALHESPSTCLTWGSVTMTQVCLAYRNGEPKVVVVMSQRPKLEMEATFRRIIPDEQRFGTRFVFREGSAIIPDNLRMVAASRAAATIIVSDSSR